MTNRRSIALPRLAFALCLGPAVAAAETPGADAEALIDRCWAASREEFDSNSTLRIGRGVSAVIDCLEHEIVVMVEASLDCVPGCGTAYNNVGAFELARRLEAVLEDLATGRNASVAGTGLTAQEVIAAGRAQANKQTTVFIHLDEGMPSAQSTSSGVIGTLVMPCNPMWAEHCEIPMRPIVRMLSNAGASPGAICDRATVHTLAACLPGFEVSPSPDGAQLYLGTIEAS